MTSTTHHYPHTHRNCSPVMWWTDWKPMPNRPTLSTSASFELWSRRPMFSQSSFSNLALFHATKAGPWKRASSFFISSLTPCSLGSTRKATLLAFASSAFWMSSWAWEGSDVCYTIYTASYLKVFELGIDYTANLQNLWSGGIIWQNLADSHH